MTSGHCKISVVVCTFNPVAEVFRECLKAIQNASRNFSPQEIIIIDNNSTEPISNRDFFTAFLQDLPQARVAVEQKQGLTHARLRGISESTGDLLIFIDDDNLIDDNYFSAAASIAQNYPFIGAFSGRVTLEYDKEPETWTRRYWGMLIYRDLKENAWSNLPFNNDTMPNGAGLCVTRNVARHYVKLFEEGKRNFVLDRSKGSLLSGGDNDLAMCACDIGNGMGLFKDLHLKHFIPGERFTLEYLSRLAYGIYFSFAFLQYMRTGKVDKNTFAQRTKSLIRTTIMKRNDRVIQRACIKGLNEAIRLIESRGMSQQ